MKKYISAFLAALVFLTVWIIPGNNVNAAEYNSSDFVRQLYSICLDRRASNFEVEYWAKQLDNHEITASSVACDFVFSDEFQSKNYTNADYVTCMYKLFLRRDPDSNGLNYWVTKMNQGASREGVFAGFANSQEFDGCCVNENIVTGVYISGYARDQVVKINLFLTRLYDTILDRHCDIDGMIYWTRLLYNKQMSGREMVSSFVASPEYVGRHPSTSSFVIAMYEVMLNRFPSNDELSYWLSQSNVSATRDTIIFDFARSPEFYLLCLNSNIDSGAPVTGWVNLDKPYYYKDGQLYTGWLKENDNWYYISGGLRKTGWVEVNSKWYYLNDSGVMQTGFVNYNSNTYYFCNDGYMLTGWQEINYNWYYFNDTGAMKTGWFQYNNHWYYFESNGKMVTGRRDINNTAYFFRDNGQMAVGWYEYSHSWYYMNDDGIRVAGWQQIGGSWYYFDTTDYHMVTGLQTIDNKVYFFDDNGKMLSGAWKYIDRTWYYFGANGNREIKTGWQKIDGYWYYFNQNGNPYYELHNIDGHYYYFEHYTGRMLTGFVENVGYFQANGQAYQGWLSYGGETYYCLESGAFALWRCTIDGNSYYFFGDGTLARSQHVYHECTRSENGGPWINGRNHYYCDADGICTFIEFIPD